MVTGAVLSILLGLIILGGIKRIAATTSKLVPAMAIIYFVGVLGVIIYNYENILPAFVSIFSNIFSGTAAMGGFLGAGVAFAFNRGVNRGLFSNEAGQGSAPIAHAAAKTKHPAAEGMVAILEPFIDTIIICMFTGMALLTSGVWHEKMDNTFQNADIIVLQGMLTEESEADRNAVFATLTGDGSYRYSGELQIENGQWPEGVTLIHARSFAEEVAVLQLGKPYTGPIPVNAGALSLPAGVEVKGKSLIHSAPLTATAFKRSIFGDFGQYIVSIGLLLFAFSTAISWSYYGDRSVTFLWGSKYVKYYRMVYVVGFFLAAIMDTTIIWTFSGIAIALMTLPNLIGILMLRKDMKDTVQDYWKRFVPGKGIED
jgi:AGCS family alanine or glycine:cation symporter